MDEAPASDPTASCSTSRSSEVPSTSGQGQVSRKQWQQHARGAVSSDPGYAAEHYTESSHYQQHAYQCTWHHGSVGGAPVMYGPYAFVAGPANAPTQVFYAFPAGTHAACQASYWVPLPYGHPTGFWPQQAFMGMESLADSSGCQLQQRRRRQPHRHGGQGRHRAATVEVAKVDEDAADTDPASSSQRAQACSSSCSAATVAIEAAGASNSDSGAGSFAGEVHGWSGLTSGILQLIMAKLGDGEVKHMRMVCRHWRGTVDHNLETLTPNKLQTHVLVQRFPNLKVLHLTGCSNVRNKDLLILANSSLSLHTLTLGDDANKHWVTNEGLAAIARMPSITSLNLHDCNGVTNNGLLALTKLQRLSTLSLKGCCKLTSGALEAIQGHTSLTSLNLYGCRVTDEAMLALTHLQLVSLHLGNTRVRDEGVGHLARITTLQELHFDREQLSDVGVAQLTSLTRLQSLALRNCTDVTTDSLGVLIPALPLISLDLKNFSMDDSQLSRCLEFLGAVTFLDLRCTPVTDDGLQQLTKLSSLQKLCLTPTQERLWSPYLCVVSNLTQLISLSINNCALKHQQLDTLRELKLLQELDLSHDSSKEELLQDDLSGQPSVNPTAIDAMAAITSLTSIDLSRHPMHEEHLSTLAERLPRLHTLIIIGCPVHKAEVQSLKRRFPEISIHHRPQLDVSCSSSDHSIG